MYLRNVHEVSYNHITQNWGAGPDTVTTPEMFVLHNQKSRQCQNNEIFQEITLSRYAVKEMMSESR